MVTDVAGSARDSAWLCDMEKMSFCFVIGLQAWAVVSLDGWLSLTLPGKAEAIRLTLGQQCHSARRRAIAGHWSSGAFLESWEWDHQNLLPHCLLPMTASYLGGSWCL